MANRRCPAPANAGIAFVFRPLPMRFRRERKLTAVNAGYQDMRARSIHGALFATLLAYCAVIGARAADAQRAPRDHTPAVKGKAQKIYASTCRICHDSGLLGAPRVGNREEWGPRVSKGRAVLLDHTINGFQKMPARGGRPSLTQKDLALVLDYMLAASQ